MLNRHLQAGIFVKRGARLVVFLLILLSATTLVLSDDQYTTGTKKLEIRASGEPCREVIGQTCTIAVGDTLTISVTATVTPSSEPISLSAVSLPPGGEFTPASGVVRLPPRSASHRPQRVLTRLPSGQPPGS